MSPRDFAEGYVDVKARLEAFHARFPDGSLQRVGEIEWVPSKEEPQLVIYTAAAYRTPDDPRPGVGTAQERVPGKTAYTRDSEVQNAETSAWGRAIAAVMPVEGNSIASADEVRPRVAEREQQSSPQSGNPAQQYVDELSNATTRADVATIWRAANAANVLAHEVADAATGDVVILGDLIAQRGKALPPSPS